MTDVIHSVGYYDHGSFMGVREAAWYSFDRLAYRSTKVKLCFQVEQGRVHLLILRSYIPWRYVGTRALNDILGASTKDRGYDHEACKR